MFLVALLFGYVWSVARLHPTNFFGLTEDDSIYFSSAKALAEGRGYVLPSVPGNPPATKYPILYPAILSLVWKLSPSFPGNLPWAIAITVGFGLTYLVAGFVFLRRLEIFSDAEVLLITGFCALHPVVLFYSSSVLSDIPFSALALIALMFSDVMLRSEARSWTAAACGVLAGLALSMRMFGLAIIGGIALAVWLRRRWRQGAVFLSGLAPFAAAITLRTLHATHTVSRLSPDSTAPLGWVRAWAYYTNYFAIWKVSVPNAHIFWSMVAANARLIAQSPAGLFLAPIFLRDTGLGHALVLLVCAAVIVGVVRLGRLRGWTTFHYAIPFYLALIALWNYPDSSNRFYIPLLFLIVAGFWIELKAILTLIQSRLRCKSPQANRNERVLAVAFGLWILFVGTAVVLNFAGGYRRQMYALSQKRAALLIEKRAAYSWLAGQNSNSVVLAYEDANVYLYAGVPAMRPIIFVTSTLYSANIQDESISHIMDVPHLLKSKYWLFAEDDFSMESGSNSMTIRDCLGGRGPSVWPEAFSSPEGRVVIRAIDKTAELRCGPSRALAGWGAGAK